MVCKIFFCSEFPNIFLEKKKMEKTDKYKVFCFSIKHKKLRKAETSKNYTTKSLAQGLWGELKITSAI